LSSIFFTDEEEEFRASVKEFAQKEIAPIAETIERGNEFRRELITKMAQHGFLGTVHENRYGGIGPSAVKEIIVGEEISAVSPAVDMARLASSVLYSTPVSSSGSDEQKKRFLTPIVKGEKIGAFCLTEPDVGSDIAGMKTRATRSGNKYVLNGEKRFIVNGSVADLLLVAAVTSPDVHPHKGMSTFVVEADSPGFEVVKDYDLMGMRGARVAHLRFSNVTVPQENIIGAENQGWEVVTHELDVERTAIAAQAVGYARTPFEVAARYSNERVQFDKPIRKFEAISFRIADMATRLEAARLLTLKAARMIDRGLRATKEAAMAKDFATETAFQTASDALQILGGVGYTKEYPVERFLRDSRLMKIGGGTTEILKFLIQREVYRELGL